MVTANFAIRVNQGCTLEATQIKKNTRISWFYLQWNQTPEGFLRIAMALEDQEFLATQDMLSTQLCHPMLQKVEYTEKLDRVGILSLYCLFKIILRLICLDFCLFSSSLS